MTFSAARLIAVLVGLAALGCLRGLPLTRD